MFLPKDTVFLNEIVDLVIEHQRFLSFPYYFPETELMEKSRKNLVKLDQKNIKHNDQTGKAATTHNEDTTSIEIKAFCVTMVLDSFDKAVLARIPEITEFLKTFTYILAKEELRQ